MQKFDIRALVLGEMFVSLTILLTYVFALHTTFVHITFGFVPIALYGAMYGPWKGALVGAAANLIGTAVLGLSIFFPGFTLSDFCTGGIYGYFFQKKGQIGWKEAWKPFLLVTVLIHLGLNTLWLVIFYDKAAEAIFLSRLIKNIICYPMEIMLFMFVHRSVYAALMWKKSVSVK